MKYLHWAIFFSSFISSVSAHSYLDSSATHSYIKITSFPFLYYDQGYRNTGGSVAIGPCISLSGERIEFQVGLLYDVRQYEKPIYAHQNVISHVQFHMLYLPVRFNIYIPAYKKIQFFPTFGGGLLVGNRHDTGWSGWAFGGLGVSLKASKKIKLSLSLHEQITSYGLAHGAFFEIAHRLK